MLVLTRRPGEEIIISDNIRVTIVSVKGDRIRIGITAPSEVSVDRAEVHERRTSFIDLSVQPQSVHAHDTALHSPTRIIPQREAQIAG